MRQFLRITFTALFAFVLTAGMALGQNDASQDNTAEVSQNGNKHSANIVQEGMNAEASVTQKGYSHAAKIKQLNKGHRVHLTQKGTKNYAYIKQVGGKDQEVNINQKGNKHFAKTTHRGNGGKVFITQRGKSQHAKASQRGKAGVVIQDQRGSNHKAIVDKRGRSNDSEQFQRGKSHYSKIFQCGGCAPADGLPGSLAKTVQNGSYHVAKITQRRAGAKKATIEQSGTKNGASIGQFGMGHVSTVKQNGANLSVSITQGMSGGHGGGGGPQ